MTRHEQEDYYRYLSKQLGVPTDLVESYLDILDDASLTAAIAELRLVTAYRKHRKEVLEQLSVEYRAKMAAIKRGGRAS